MYMINICVKKNIPMCIIFSNMCFNIKNKIALVSVQFYDTIVSVTR